MWRSFWVQRQGEGWPVAAVVLVGGDGVRFRERTRGEEERENERECSIQTAVATSASSSRWQGRAGRQLAWRAERARAPGTCLAYWREVGDGAVASWAARCRASTGAGPQVGPGKVIPIYFFFYFSNICLV